MIDIKQLRIGNLLCHNKAIVTVNEILFDARDNKHYLKLKEMEYGYIPAYFDPVPIIPDILEKAGFEKNSGLLGPLLGHNMNLPCGQGNFKRVTVSYNSDQSHRQYYVFLGEGSLTDISDNNIVTLRRDLQYLHQLQNLCYELGKELNITL